MLSKRKTAGVIAWLLLLLCLTACGEGQKQPEKPSVSPGASSAQSGAALDQPASAPQTQETPATQKPAATPAPPNTPPAPPQPEDGALAALRYSMGPEDLCAAAFLGYLEEPAQLSTVLEESGYLEEYPFLADIPPERSIGFEGTELYCIVPREDGDTVTVSRWTVENGEIVSSHPLYCGGGEPFLVWGNFSDVVPNIRVVITAPEIGELDYTPCLSLKDGSLCTADGPFTVMDFTRYEAGGAKDLP